MREIKFRAWDRREREMLNVCRLGLGGFSHDFWFPDQFCDSRISDTERYEFMQFTGLLDLKGKEIWEGDIIKFNVRSKTYIKSIAWAECFAGFRIVGELDRLHDPIHWKIEVIGNIYSNPELIK